MGVLKFPLEPVILREMEPRISIITLGVRDLPRAIRFYRDGLGLPTTAAEDASIAFFKTAGTRFALYPREQLARDIAPDLSVSDGFGGITLAHNVRQKSEVDAILQRAAASGGRIVKPAHDTFWGGYSGYFVDPDGYHWEVAWGPMFSFDDRGELQFDD